MPGSGVKPGDKVVALTFDDGPSPTFTPQVLAILAHYQVHATFFMVGMPAAAHPDLVRQVVAAGNTVGGHTWSHVILTTLADPAAFAAQVDQADSLLGSLTGHPIRCVRPPGGHFDPTVIQRLGARGIATVVWSDDTRDWSKPGTPVIVQRAMSALKPGSIIVLHDGGGDRTQTVAALPTILDAISAAGYRVVPVCA